MVKKPVYLSPELPKPRGKDKENHTGSTASVGGTAAVFIYIGAIGIRFLAT
jgi:hypothetical protein